MTHHTPFLCLAHGAPEQYLAHKMRGASGLNIKQWRLDMYLYPFYTPERQRGLRKVEVHECPHCGGYVRVSSDFFLTYPRAKETFYFNFYLRCMTCGKENKARLFIDTAKGEMYSNEYFQSALESAFANL